MTDARQIRLRPAVLRGRQRVLSMEARPVPPIEAVTVERIDARVLGMEPRVIRMSLPRVRFLERKPQ